MASSMSCSTTSIFNGKNIRTFKGNDLKFLFLSFIFVCFFINHCDPDDVKHSCKKLNILFYKIKRLCYSANYLFLAQVAQISATFSKVASLVSVYVVFGKAIDCKAVGKRWRRISSHMWESFCPPYFSIFFVFREEVLLFELKAPICHLLLVCKVQLLIFRSVMDSDQSDIDNDVPGYQCFLFQILTHIC